MIQKQTIYLDNPIFSGRLRRASSEDVDQIRIASTRQVIETPELVVDVQAPAVQKSDVRSSSYTKPDIRRAFSSRQVEEKQTPIVEPVIEVASIEPEELSDNLLFSDQMSDQTKTKSAQPKLLMAMAVVLFAIGIFVAVQTFLTNKTIVSAGQTPSVASAATGGEEKKPNPIYDYKVAADMPRFIRVPSIGAFGRVQHLGLDDKNQIQTPGNVADAGWFNESAKIGKKSKLASLIDGHVSGWTAKGIFFDLKKLTSGDVIEIEMGDGTKYKYAVNSTQEFNKDSVNTAKLLTPIEKDKEGLNLITCTGKVTGDSYDKRLAVYASRIN